MSNRARFQVSFEGPALERGLMDVRELAPSLLAIGNLIEAANRRLNGDRARIAVQVHADFERGSFSIDLVGVQTFMEQVKAFVLGDDFKAARELLVLVFGSGSVVGLIRWLKGRKPESATTLENGNVSIVIDNRKTEVNGDVYLLYQDPMIRAETRAALQPLAREGIESVSIKAPKGRKTKIEKQELPYFEDDAVDLDRQDGFEGEHERMLALVKPSFRDDLRWNFTDGTNAIGAYMRDDAFLERVHRREVTFGDGDLLRVRLCWHAVRTDAGLQTTYTILEVLEIIQMGSQRRLPMRDSSAPPTENDETGE